MGIVAVTGTSQQVTQPDGSPALLANLDTAATIYLDNSRSVSAYSTQLPPLGTLAVDGQRPWFAATAAGQSAALQVTPGGTQWSPSPAQIAEQIALTGINVTVTGLSVVAPSGETAGVKDTTALQSALDSATGEVLLAAGTFYVNKPLVLPSNVALRGVSRGATVLKLAAGVNAPIMISQDFAALTGSGSNTAGVTGFSVRDIVFDGNAAGQTAAAAAAVQIYGYDYLIENVSIRDFLAGDGLYTEFGLAGTPGPEKAMESHFRMLRIHDNTLTGAGWRNRGPHDSQLLGVIIYNNGTTASGYRPETSPTYSGSACLVSDSHVWGNHAVAWDLAAETHCVNCVAEGAVSSQVLVTSGDCSWTGGIVFPGGPGAGNGFQLGSASAQCTGFVMGDPLITGFAGTAAGNAAVNVVNTASGKYSALIFQPSGRAIFGIFQPYELRRISFGGLVTPAVAAAAGAGTAPPAPTLSNGSDNRGALNLGTGTGPTSGLQASLTWAQPKPGTPTVAVWPMNGATAALQPYLDGVSTTGFGVGFVTAPAAGQPAGTYVVGYADETG